MVVVAVVDEALGLTVHLVWMPYAAFKTKGSGGCVMLGCITCGIRWLISRDKKFAPFYWPVTNVRAWCDKIIIAQIRVRRSESHGACDLFKMMQWNIKNIHLVHFPAGNSSGLVRKRCFQRVGSGTMASMLMYLDGLNYINFRRVSKKLTTFRTYSHLDHSCNFAMESS